MKKSFTNSTNTIKSDHRFIARLFIVASSIVIAIAASLYIFYIIPTNQKHRENIILAESYIQKAETAAKDYNYRVAAKYYSKARDLYTENNDSKSQKAMQEKFDYYLKKVEEMNSKVTNIGVSAGPARD